MSQQKSEAALAETFSEHAIADYLRSHPDYFDRHPALLLRLRLPHRTGGAAISLVERQVALLRERNDKLERQLKDLVAVAKLNDALVEKIHQLSLRLLHTHGVAGRLALLEKSLREDLLAERAVLVLFADAAASVESDGFVKVIERADPGLKPFSGFLRAARPRCGSMQDRQKALIFEREADAIASAALVPLGQDEGLLGFLVIGNRDPGHFHPGKRMDFLNRLGELVTVALGAGSAQVASRARS
jgi:uncharacterized protein YigA (DUF484 family)